MIDRTEVVGTSGVVVESILTVMQQNEILQLVQIILSIVTFLLTISYTIWKWYKKAKDEDSDGGKDITDKEIDELIEDLKNHKEDK